MGNGGPSESTGMEHSPGVVARHVEVNAVEGKAQGAMTIALDDTSKLQREATQQRGSGGSGDGGGVHSRLLYHPRDEARLSRLLCLVRSHIEVFVVPPSGCSDLRFRRMQGKVDAGRVGFMCIHCTGSLSAGSRGADSDGRTVCRPVSRNGAVSYPKSIRFMCQAVRDWQRHHLLGCPDIPPEVKERYRELKTAPSKDRTSRMGSGRYWEESCRRMGMIDTDNGIRLRTGQFLDDDDEEEVNGETVETSATPEINVERQVTGSQATASDAVTNDSHEVDSGEVKKVEEDACSHFGVLARSPSVQRSPPAPVDPCSPMACFGSNAATAVPHEPKATAGSIVSQQSKQKQALISSDTACHAEAAVQTLSSHSLRKGEAFERLGPILPKPTTAVVQHGPLLQGSRPPALQTEKSFGHSSLSCPQERGSPMPERNITPSPAQLELSNSLLLCSPLETASPMVNPDNGGTQLPRTFRGSPGVSNAGKCCPLDASQSCRNSETTCRSVIEGGDNSMAATNQRALALGEIALEEDFFLEGVCEKARSERETSPPTDKVAFLDRLKMAHSIVQTIEEMGRQSLGASEDKDDDSWRTSKEDLSFLGRELYELFSGRRPFNEQQGEEACSASEMDGILGPDGTNDSALSMSATAHNYARQTQEQKKKRHQSTSEYVSLIELGIPSTTLCSLVSCLLDTTLSSTNYAVGNSCYRTIKEVEEDLGLMATDPERYLFDWSTAVPNGHPQLEIPVGVLYGRSRELSTLHKAFDRAISSVGGKTTGREMVLISGYSGCGKSALVTKAQGELIKRGARFMSGKFDAMRQVQPLSAIISALDEFCGLLAQDVVMSEEVRVAIKETIGGEANVLTALIPSLGNVVGTADQSPVHISGRQARQRLFFLFRVLFRVLCSDARPVVLFLDDLQWVDEASLELLQVLIMDFQIKGLLFIGTYRDNEVGSGHMLMNLLRDVQRTDDVEVTSLHLSNLSKTNVSDFLSDILRLLPRMTLGLAEVVLHKTGGNALFMVQFLQSLYDDGLLRFSLSTKRWEWDIDRIREKDISDDVVELMTEKLLRLPTGVQRALRTVAGLGAKCHENLLHVLDRGDLRLVGRGSLADQVDLAVKEGLLVKTGPTYKFSHDQIQLAAYLLVPEAEREAFHLQIGRMLWRLLSPEELEHFLFVVVDQLHRGCCLITDHDEKIEFAELCLKSGRMACEMSAFFPASVYFKYGIGLLMDEDWDRQRMLCLDLYSSCSEMEYILGDFASMQGHLEAVFGNALTLREKLRAYYIQVQSHTAQSNTIDALFKAIEVLGQLGESLSSSPTSELIKKEIATTLMMLKDVDFGSLGSHKMQHQDKLQAMKFLSLVICVCFAERKDYFTLLTCRMVQLSLSHGVCKDSAKGFACFSTVLCGMGHITEGYRLGKIALSIVDEYNAKDCVASVCVFVHGFVNPWIEPIQSCLSCHKCAFDAGLSLGDTENAMINAHMYTGTALQTGQPLGPLVEEMRVYSKQMLEYVPFINTLNMPMRQAALNLVGKSANPIKLVGSEMDEDSLLANVCGGYPLLRSTTLYYRMWLEYLFGEYELAAETAQMNAEVEKHNAARAPLMTNHAFYYGLTALALARKEGKTKWIGVINKSMKQMEDWFGLSSWNFQNKLELLKAEYAYLAGDPVGAAQSYDLAIELAGKHRFIHEEALALDRAGIFYSESGDHVTASIYFSRALERYSDWGACSKVASIQERLGLK